MYNVTIYYWVEEGKSYAIEEVTLKFNHEDAARRQIEEEIQWGNTEMAECLELGIKKTGIFSDRWS